MGALILLGISAGLFIQGVITLFEGETDTGTLSLMMAGGIIFTATLTLPATYYSLRRLMGYDDSAPIVIQRGILDALVLLIFWPLLITLGHFAVTSPFAWLVMPIVSTTAVSIPILFLLRLALNRLQDNTRKRVWSTFGLGLTVGPGVIMVAEVAILLVIVVVVVAILMSQPNTLNQLQYFVVRANNMSEEEILALIIPWIYKPWFLLGIFGFVALIVPIIEELFKTLPLWFFGKRIQTPAEGFALGVLSGSAFALFENIGYAANDTEMWAITAVVRMGAGIMHILTGGLMGWALASAWQKGKFVRLSSTYLMVVVIHGLWNAMGIGLGLGMLATLTENTPVFWRNFPYAAFGTLLTLAFGGMLVIIRANRLMRHEQNNRAESTQGMVTEAHMPEV